MAQKQTRRTFSVSRATYDAATAAAARDGIATSEWVTRLIRQACPELPHQLHASDKRPAHTMDEYRAQRRAERRMSAKDVERALAPEPRADVLARNPHLAPIPPGATCAHCGERDATMREQEAPYYVTCARCASDARPSGRVVERGYEPNGGLPTAKEAHEGALRVVSEDRWKRDSRDILNMQRGPTPPGVLGADPRRDR